MAYVASALVPFLAVYASMDYLKQDLSRYQYLVLVDETFARADVFDGEPSRIAERLPMTMGLTLGSVVVVAIVLRWLLSMWQGRHPWPWLGLVGAYLEVIWLVVVAVALRAAQGPVIEWVQERRIVNWLTEQWHHLVAVFGPAAPVLRIAGTWFAGLLASADAVIVVPIAWLTVGAVVYGHRLTPPPARTSGLYRRAARRWVALPSVVRAAGSGIVADLRDRFGPLFHGLRLLARAGLAPMLLFCLAFVASQGVQDWLWELERVLVGPRDLATVWMPISGPFSVLNETIAMVLLACLLAAAVDRALRSQPPEPAPDAAGPADPPDAAVPAAPG